jgi:hypothetical protein
LGTRPGFWYVPTRFFTKAKGDKRPIVIMTASLTLTKEHNIGAMAEKIRAGPAHRTAIVGDHDTRRMALCLHNLRIRRFAALALRRLEQGRRARNHSDRLPAKASASCRARYVGGIDSIATGHWTVEFRRPIFLLSAKQVGR